MNTCVQEQFKSLKIQSVCLVTYGSQNEEYYI